MASIFFNFGTDGATAGEKTYYFDNVAFGDFVLSDNNLFLEKINIFPNPANGFWNVSSKDATIIKVEIYNIQGQLVLSTQPKSNFEKISSEGFISGMYLLKVTTEKGNKTFKVLKN